MSHKLKWLYYKVSYILFETKEKNHRWIKNNCKHLIKKSLKSFWSSYWNKFIFMQYCSKRWNHFEKMFRLSSPKEEYNLNILIMLQHSTDFNAWNCQVLSIKQCKNCERTVRNKRGKWKRRAVVISFNVKYHLIYSRYFKFSPNPSFECYSSYFKDALDNETQSVESSSSCGRITCETKR